MEEYGKLFTNVSLKDYNTLKVGGYTKYLIKPYNVESLIKLIEYLKNNNIDYYLLGGGSNVILPDKDYDGCIILLSNLNKVSIDGELVRAEAGIPLTKFVMELINNDLAGLEPLCGVPGTLGGAIYGNAGSFGGTISDYIESIKYFSEGEIKTISKSEASFSYRNSIFKNMNNVIILEATFKLKKSDKDDLLKIVRENQEKRLATQPIEHLTVGSVFKNPEGMSAGKLIDDLGLKGFSINDASISMKHANFIINKGNATSKDIIDLIEYIRKKVKDKYNVDLELEPIIIRF